MREGDKIILPAGMSYAEGRVWLSRQEESEEKTVNILDNLPCYALDGIVALARTLKEIYGFTDLGGLPGFWGDNPPIMIQIQTPDGVETAPLGKLMPPKWEGGWLLAKVTDGLAINITGSIKRKFEGELKRITQRVREILTQSSIYKGKATLVDLTWMQEGRDFHPMNDAPKFMDLSGSTRLILNKQTAFELSTSVFMLLERTKECVANNIKLKHGALFTGTFGTGKSLTAKVLAQKATENGWTFLYLKHAGQLASGLRLAELFAPAVVFAEDVDTVATGDRDQQLNDLLNTIDGVDTKDKPIITILTTNLPELISPAFLRAGRIDTVVQFTPPDAETAVEFVKVFARDDEGRNLLAPDQDLTGPGKALAGMVPAFICEAVAKAKRFAIYREGADIIGKMLAEDVEQAATSIRAHQKMAEGTKQPTQAERVAEAVKTVGDWQQCGELP